MTQKSTLRAIVQRSYGRADVLQVETVDLPSIGEKQVLIEVYCAGLDRGTWHLAPNDWNSLPDQNFWVRL